MNKILFILLFLILAAYGQQQKLVSIAGISDDGSPPLGVMELGHLTDRLHAIASETLPQKYYTVAVDTGGKSDYVVRSRLGRFGSDFTVKVELYDSKNSALVGFFSDNSKDIYGLLAIFNEKAPAMFGRLPSEPVAEAPPAAIPFVIPATSVAQVPVAKSAGYTGTNACHREIFNLIDSKRDFNVQSFVKDLGVSVAKVQASCKTKWTCLADDKMADIGLTAGCVKQLPAKPDEVLKLLKDIGIDVAKYAAINVSQDLGTQSFAQINSGIENIEEKGSGGFWVALTLDLIGAGLITYGIIKNNEVKDLHSEYMDLPRGSWQFDSKWKKADDARSTRNVLYIVGGVVLATGIGVHIWF